MSSSAQNGEGVVGGKSAQSDQAAHAPCYFVFERKYVGPAQAEDLDADEFLISTAPLRAGPSAGASAGSAAWLGHADNWRVSLQGRYASVDQAVQRVAVLCGGEFRRVEVPADRPGVVQCFKPGRLRPMGAQASIDFVEPAAQ